MELKVDPVKIRQLRLNKSWSQEELAEKAKVSLRTVQRMEIDGSTSLKSRRAIAHALGVEPALLNCAQPVETGYYEEADNPTSRQSNKKSHEPGFFAYPGPTSIPGKIRTPLLVVFWAGMIITGGLFLLVVLVFTALQFFYSGVVSAQLLMPAVPLFVVFVFFLGLYQLFRRFGSTASS